MLADGKSWALIAISVTKNFKFCDLIIATKKCLYLIPMKVKGEHAGHEWRSAIDSLPAVLFLRTSWFWFNFLE